MTIKEQVKRLWKRCFDDSDEFIELYFRLRYTNDSNLFLCNAEKQVVSALQMPIYSIRYGDTRRQAAYISGACTHPDYRGKGLMAELLGKAFERMDANQIPLSFLIPAEHSLFDYYMRFGYRPSFFRRRTETAVAALAPSNSSLFFVHGTTFLRAWENFFLRETQNYYGYVEHSFADLKGIMADLALSGGGITLALSDEKIVGMAFTRPEKDYLYAAEVLAEDKTIENALLYEAARHTHKDKILRYIPVASAKEGEPFGMIRINDGANSDILTGDYPLQMSLMLE